jgi:molybdopterin converting factor subunit 1
LTIRIRVLYFGQTRDGSGLGEESFSLPSGSSVATLARQLISSHPGLRKMMMTTQLALNEELANGDEPLKEGDVVALLPPVAGG